MKCKFCGKNIKKNSEICICCGRNINEELGTNDLIDAMPEIHDDFDIISKHVLNIALNYGSRIELVRAFNALKGKDGEITEKDVAEQLYTAGLPDIDLVVRTSGEMRLSNFFLWQCAYSEFYFTDVLWPDFDEEETKKAIDWFYGRKRRFGGIEDA